MRERELESVCVVCVSVSVCEIAMREWEGMRACGLFCSQGDTQIMQKRKKKRSRETNFIRKKAEEGKTTATTVRMRQI